MTEHLVVDGYPVEVGKKFWSNDLKVVQITEVGTDARPYLDSGETATWHKTNDGSYDTLTGNLQWIGRLIRFYPSAGESAQTGYESLDAEDFEPGTSYLDVKRRK